MFAVTACVLMARERGRIGSDAAIGDVDEMDHGLELALASMAFSSGLSPLV